MAIPLAPVPGSVAYDELVVGFRFGVYFFVGGVLPNPLDTRFRKVSGLAAEVTTIDHPEGGQNLYTHRLPQRVKYNNLVLERGLVVGSPLNLEFNAAMTAFKFLPSNVLVILFSEDRQPITSWLFMRAFPVRWATSDLDADRKEVVIDTMELAYSSMQILRV